MSHYYQYSDAKEKLKALRKAARDFLRETARAPYRAVDVDQRAVDEAFKRLAKLSGFR